MQLFSNKNLTLNEKAVLIILEQLNFFSLRLDDIDLQVEMIRENPSIDKEDLIDVTDSYYDFFLSRVPSFFQDIFDFSQFKDEFYLHDFWKELRWFIQSYDSKLALNGTDAVFHDYKIMKPFLSSMAQRYGDYLPTLPFLLKNQYDFLIEQKNLFNKTTVDSILFDFPNNVYLFHKNKLVLTLPYKF